MFLVVIISYCAEKRAYLKGGRLIEGEIVGENAVYTIFSLFRYFYPLAVQNTYLCKKTAFVTMKYVMRNVDHTLC